MQTECTGAKKESPIVKALSILKGRIGDVQETQARFESILAIVIAPPEKPATEPQKEVSVSPQTSLESQLNEMANDVVGINIYLRELQNRIQL